MIQNKENLIAKISEAFKGVELDGGIGLSEANAIDEYKDEAFKAECRKQDEKQNWKTISSDSLNNYYCALSFFDAKGMKFHLPAFMIAELNNEYRFGIAFPLTHLTDYTKSQFTLLDKKQREAVRFFIEYLAEQDEFERPVILSAIENYWSH